MLSAAFLASAMASMAMEILSFPQSPPANTPGMLVMKCICIVSDGVLSGLVAVEDTCVNSLAYGKDHGVYSDGLSLAFNRYRSSPAGSVRFHPVPLPEGSLLLHGRSRP